MKNTNDLADKALAPLIKHCAKTRGAMAEVCREFNRGLAPEIRRTTIERWLHPDKTKRTEPLLGAGLRLLSVWNKMQNAELVNIGVASGHVLKISNVGDFKTAFCSCWAWGMSHGPTKKVLAAHQKHQKESEPHEP